MTFGSRLTALRPVQVAQAGLVPFLVALLEQVPCPTTGSDEVQDQAACLLLEAATSDLGTVQISHINLRTASTLSAFESVGLNAELLSLTLQEELVHLNCVTQLTAALLSGSCVKRARVIAILGMISISTQDQQKPDHLIQYCQTMMVLAVSTVPEVVTVLSQSGTQQFCAPSYVLPCSTSGC